MHSPNIAAFCLIALSSAWPAHAERLSIGVSMRRDRSCLRGAFTGAHEAPDDAWGPAGSAFGCLYDDDLVRTNGGVVVNVPLSRRFALRVDPGLATSGYEYYSRSLVTLRLDSVQLPVHARFVLVPGGAVHPYALAGGFVSRWRNRETVGDVFRHNDRAPSEVTYLYRRESWRGWNAGISGGGGLAFDIATVQLFGEVVYERGLVDIYRGRNIAQRTRNRRVAAGFTVRVGR